MEKPGELSVNRQAERQLAEQLRACNAVSARFGLTLSETAIASLSQARSEALAETGRVEFGGARAEDRRRVLRLAVSVAGRIRRDVTNADRRVLYL